MIDFTQYTTENIESDMLAQVDDSFDKRTGSVIQTGIGPVAWYLEGVYMTLSQLQQNAYAATAVGEYLDNIVPERGIARKQAEPAVRQGLFNIQIPEGSAFKTINGKDSVIFTVNSFLRYEEYYVYSMTLLIWKSLMKNSKSYLKPLTSPPKMSRT